MIDCRSASGTTPLQRGSSNRAVEASHGARASQTRPMCEALDASKPKPSRTTKPPLIQEEAVLFRCNEPPDAFDGKLTHYELWQNRHPGSPLQPRSSPLEQPRHLVVPLHPPPARLHQAARPLLAGHAFAGGSPAPPEPFAGCGWAGTATQAAVRPATECGCEGFRFGPTW